MNVYLNEWLKAKLVISNATSIPFFKKPLNGHLATLPDVKPWKPGLFRGVSSTNTPESSCFERSFIVAADFS
jgi:hypothetical protein